MATKVVMEALSPTMEEGRLVAWTKKEGDAVKAGDTLAEVETDKAVMELVARTDGVLRLRVVAEGATVPVGAVVAFIGAADEVIERTGAPAHRGTETERTGAPAHRGTEVDATAAAAPSSSRRIFASPLARRLATERGVDLRGLAGSGPGGRVVKRDVEAAQAAATAPATAKAEPAPPGGYRDVPLTLIRKTIAKRLSQSLGPIPHFYLTSEIEMERAAEMREQLKAHGDAYAVSFNDIVVKAVALALRQHAAVNAAFLDDRIRYYGDIDVGVAVAVADGLITPVLRHADRKGLAEIAAESRALAERARARKLQPDEYTGATFSVSNLGMFEIDQFTAVINPPEAAILAVGRVVAKPVAVAGAVVVRRTMRVTLSCDHRVVDGATGARFLQSLKLMLENPLAMLL
jgi:pyruvate dehydrogenase E2 component (dihydrolipoamide acetyltransferase)